MTARIPQHLSWLIVILTAAASAGGLFLGLYQRETAWVIPQAQGQDLITLAVAIPALIAALLGVRRGSARATLVWVGLLGYIFYTYTGAAFSYRFNSFFLIYVALFSLSIFALVTALGQIDMAGLARKFDAGVPRRGVVIYLAVLALVLPMMWLGQIVPFFTSGTLPELIRQADTPTNFVYVLDLGIVVPVAVLAAVWLWRRAAWGYLLAGFIMIKGAAMGLALLGMTWFCLRAGVPTDLGLTGVWITLAVSSLAMATWFLRHCRG